MRIYTHTFYTYTFLRTRTYRAYQTYGTCMSFYTHRLYILDKFEVSEINVHSTRESSLLK